MNKELILTYIYGKDYRFKGLPGDKKGNYLFDGNLMTAAMNKMVEKGEWEIFVNYSCYLSNRHWIHLKPDSKFYFMPEYIWWLMQPDRFFELMSETLKKGVIGK